VRRYTGSSIDVGTEFVWRAFYTTTSEIPPFLKPPLRPPPNRGGGAEGAKRINAKKGGVPAAKRNGQKKKAANVTKGATTATTGQTAMTATTATTVIVTTAMSTKAARNAGGRALRWREYTVDTTVKQNKPFF